MAVSTKRAREMALALENASAAPHFDREAFRTPRKIFATLGPSGRDLNLMLDPAEQELFVSQSPQAFSALPNKWGAMGGTRVELAQVSAGDLTAALELAHRRANTPLRKGKKR